MNVTKFNESENVESRDLEHLRGLATRKANDVLASILGDNVSLTILLVRLFRKGGDVEKARACFDMLASRVEDARATYEKAITMPNPNVRWGDIEL